MSTKNHRLNQLGLRIRAMRIAAGMTQAQLAALCNKDQQSIQRLEAGKINPSFFYLIEIASGLNVTIAELVSEYSPPLPRD